MQLLLVQVPLPRMGCAERFKPPNASDLVSIMPQPWTVTYFSSLESTKIPNSQRPTTPEVIPCLGWGGGSTVSLAVSLGHEPQSQRELHFHSSHTCLHPELSCQLSSCTSPTSRNTTPLLLLLRAAQRNCCPPQPSVTRVTAFLPPVTIAPLKRTEGSLPAWLCEFHPSLDLVSLDKTCPNFHQQQSSNNPFVKSLLEALALWLHSRFC